MIKFHVFLSLLLGFGRGEKCAENVRGKRDKRDKSVLVAGLYGWAHGIDADLGGFLSVGC